MIFKPNYDSEGNQLSPTLKQGIKNFLIDIDGTICDDVPNEEPERMTTATPLPGAKEAINKFYEEGNVITFFTSRTEEHRERTTNWLDEHGFLYHDLLMGKPRGGNYAIIDNHLFVACHYQGNWNSVLDQMKDVHVKPYKFSFNGSN
tara:strand:+ start:1764 stop:2204 length:441 start_codon:yes stop_codon:yes gene_type:complete